MKRLLQKITHHPLYIKWAHWEFWPMQILYFPVYFQHVWLSVKAKSLFFFLKTNPAINDGFILSDSKYKTLQLVPKQYVPKTILIKKEYSLHEVKNLMKSSEINYPIILKPDIGYRGLLVNKVEHEDQLHYLLKTGTIDYLIQEYIDFPLEVGIFYYRLPDAKNGDIPSITIKEFLKVKGTDKHTLAELISVNPRAILQADRLKKKFNERWNSIIPKGEEMLLEVIGNHNRGTKFTNANHLLDDALQHVFDDLNNEMKGFYFGRFDIRTASIEDLKSGKNFKILEVNGVGAEPTHIYDPDYKLTKAWKELLHLWRMVYRIAMQNQQSGMSFPSFSESKKRWKRYHNYKKALLTS